MVEASVGTSYVRVFCLCVFVVYVYLLFFDDFGVLVCECDWC